MIVLNLFLFYFIQRNYQIISIHIKQKPLQLNKCGRKQKKKKTKKNFRLGKKPIVRSAKGLNKI